MTRRTLRIYLENLLRERNEFDKVDKDALENGDNLEDKDAFKKMDDLKGRDNFKEGKDNFDVDDLNYKNDLAN